MPPHLAIKKPHFFIWRLSQLLHYINVKQTTSTYSLSQKKKRNLVKSEILFSYGESLISIY